MRYLATTLTLLMCVVSCQAKAGTIYNQTLTGRDIFDSPGAQFPTRSPSVSGDSLVFGTGQTFDQLALLPILAAGVVSSTDTVTIDLTTTTTRLTGDSDNQLGFMDGNGNVVSYWVQDQGGGVGGFHEAVANGDSIAISGAYGLFSGAGFPPIGSSTTASGLFQFADGIDSFSLSFGTGTGEISLNTAFDPSSGLSFLYWSSDPAERYQLDLVGITVESSRVSPVPEPSTGLMWCILVGLYAAIRRRNPRQI